MCSLKKLLKQHPPFSVFRNILMRFSVRKNKYLSIACGRLSYSAAVAVLMCAFAQTVSATPAEGRKKALQCQTCHGLDGMAKIPEAPNLAGQNPQYLVKALQDFKSGARQNEMMSAVAEMLSPQDMEVLAGYYSGLPYIQQSPEGK